MKKVLMLIILAVVFYSGSENTLLFAEERNIQEEIIYDILIDRYNNGDHQNDEQVNVEDPLTYHGGDIQGIIMKLDELLEYGITSLSLSPIMANAEEGYHGYWIEDFYAVEEQFGTMEDLQLLIEEAHQRDMKVVMEFVTGYMAPTNEIAQDPDKEDWKIEHDVTNLDWIQGTEKLDLENEEVQQYMLDVAEYWITETDIDGFNIHAVDQIPISFLEVLTEHMKSLDSNLYLMGEVLESDENSEEILENTEIEVMENTALNQAMRSTFSEEDNEVSDIYQVWEDSANQMSALKVDDMYSKRFTQEFAENGRNNVTVWKLALTYMLTTPGVPVLYQGSEIPMYGADAQEAQRLVEFNSGESELEEFYHKITSLRSQFPVQLGDFELVDSSNAMSVFRRSYEDETIYVAINNSTTSQDITISDIEPGMELRGYIADNLVRENENGDYRLGLPRESVEVFILQDDTGLNWGFISFVAGILLLFVFAVIYLSRKEKKREAQK